MKSLFYRLSVWWDTERTKLRPLTARQRAEYIWMYYRLWIVGILCTVLLVSTGISGFAASRRENWLAVCFANTYAELGNGSAFWKDYAQYAGYDLEEGNLYFNAQIYVDPARQSYGNHYYNLLVSLMDSGTLDAVVMERDRLRTLGSSGRLMDLEDERMETLYRTYGNRLVWCSTDTETESISSTGKTKVAVGIDLRDSLLVGESRAYPENAALGINALAPHPEQVEVFLQYLFGENGSGNP